jgi:DNA-binding beta-propeller fold protein YncE
MRALLTGGLIFVGASIGLLRAQADVSPVNDRPNPFVTESRWAPLPPPRPWGATSAVDLDRDGRSIWVADRCGANSCATSDLAPVMKLDATGRVMTSFGAGLFSVPHGIHVSHDGTIWMTDDSTTAVAGKGHQVLQFDSSGKLLRRLGTAGVPGIGPDAFNRPSDVLVAPNGDIFVADGHGGDSNARIVKFSADGRFIKTWGRKGTARGEFDTPHSLAMDSRGRLFVADLRNFRIQIFDQDGNFLDEWKQFGMPGGLFIDRNDTIYVADSLSNSQVHPGWIRGIRIGSARDGTVTAFIRDPTPEANPITAAEGVAADTAGNVYGAIVGTPQLQRHARTR